VIQAFPAWVTLDPVDSSCEARRIDESNAENEGSCSCASPKVRGRLRRRRQGTRCEGYCNAMLSARLTAPYPRLGTATHMRSAVTLRSMAKARLAGDQPLNRPNLIGKASLNVFEPGGGCEIIAVAKNGFHAGYEEFGFMQEVLCLGQFRGGRCIQRLNLGGGHVSSPSRRNARQLLRTAQYLILSKLTPSSLGLWTTLRQQELDRAQAAADGYLNASLARGHAQ
jgi:hypothetical protein